VDRAAEGIRAATLAVHSSLEKRSVSLPASTRFRFRSVILPTMHPARDDRA